MRNDIDCDFIDLEPDEGLKNFVWSVAQNIQDLAPTNSSLKFVVRKKENKYQATCRIFSYAGVFEAEAMSEREMTAVRNAEERICYKLDVWKHQRFKSSEHQGKLRVAL